MPFEDLIIENGVLRGYTGSGGAVVIPGDVVSIGQNAFRDVSGVRSVVLPDGVTDIGRGAFWNCEDLESVRMPSSLRSIGPWAFYSCRSLKNIDLPEGLGFVGECAFRDCISLTEAVLSDALTNIGVSVFEGCRKLHSLRLPDGLIGIEDNAFRGCASLEALSLPERLTSIGERTFWGCSALKEIRFPHSLERIGKDAFYYCVGLKLVVFPENISSIGRCAFYGCGALDDVRFPARPIDVGRAAFAKTAWFDAQPEGCVMTGATLYQYKGLLPERAMPTLPAQTRAVAEHAFCSQPGLEKIVLPRDVAFIGESAFEDCFNLKSVVLSDELTAIGAGAFLRCSSLKDLRLPSGLVSIGAQAFKGCSSLGDAVLPAALRYIGEDAFTGCAGLRRFSAAPEAAWFTTRDGVLFSRSGKELKLYPPGRPDKSYSVPEGVERLSPGAFSGAVQLKTLFLPGTLPELPSGAFSRTELEYVRLPRSIARLSPGVFRSETYVGFYYPELAETTERPVFLGGGIDRIAAKHKSAALLGFLAAMEHGETAVERWRESYVAYVRRNEAACARIAQRNEALLHLMMEEKILSRRSTEELLAEAMKDDRTDLTAELLSYQEKAFPRRGFNAFSLDDGDAAGKKTALRREDLLRRVGIAGLRFAVAGKLRKFGFYSPLGVVDMSDLRSFIKKRGGELQFELREDTDCLICSDPASVPDKLRKAAQQGVPVISEEEFLKIASEIPTVNYTGINM